MQRFSRCIFELKEMRLRKCLLRSVSIISSVPVFKDMPVLYMYTYKMCVLLVCVDLWPRTTADHILYCNYCTLSHYKFYLTAVYALDFYCQERVFEEKKRSRLTLSTYSTHTHIPPLVPSFHKYQSGYIQNGRKLHF